MHYRGRQFPSFDQFLEHGTFAPDTHCQQPALLCRRCRAHTRYQVAVAFASSNRVRPQSARSNPLAWPADLSADRNSATLADVVTNQARRWRPQKFHARSTRWIPRLPDIAASNSPAFSRVIDTVPIFQPF